MSSNFMNTEELEQLILLYRANIEQIRQSHDNLLSMMVVLIHHSGGTVKIPYSEIEELGEGVPYTIRMVPDEQGEHMVISIERIEDDGGDSGEDGTPENISDFSGRFSPGSGKGRGPKLDA